jgi:hypothetical protein
MVKKVIFSNLNTQLEFKKDEPVVYLGNSANKTRIMNYIFITLNLITLIGFILLFYFLDMISA